MNQNIALIIALAAPVLVLLVLRVNASLVFLSLCLGAVLVQYVAPEANNFLQLVSAHVNAVSKMSVQLLLLLAPAAVTTVVTVFSVHGRIKGLVNILPAVAAAALLVLLAVPLLPPGLKHTMEAQRAWHYLSNADALVVSAGALVSLCFLWTQRALFQKGERRRR
ncbi:MAG TPA: hypothetical protein VLF71_03440 [Candidatus Saccharimonadales bacterium]|nr:hypothetical protein [Candidatus Saccharimonadales bacterium]